MPAGSLRESSNAVDASGGMSDRVFSRLSELIYATCGIKMPPAKKTMLEGRLRKRLRSLSMSSFDKYFDYLSTTEGMQAEGIHMIDVVTTNKTDFFREPGHFDYLLETGLPELVNNYGLGIRKKLNVWSAGCSTGEEPYTLAMVLSEFAARCPGFEFCIFATDISTRVLEKARLGVYDHDRVETVPLALRKKYLLRSKDRAKDLVKIAPELRARVKFQRLNLMDGEFSFREPMGIIFFRNVMIYFDRPTQEGVLGRLCEHLVPGGYLVTGHSETLQGMSLPLIHPTTRSATTIYRRR